MWIFLSMALSACSLCLLAWWLARPLLALAGAGQSGKPFILQLIWPWINAVAPVCQPHLSWHLRRRLDRLLWQSGAEHYWTSQHFCALQALVAVFCAVSVLLLLWGWLAPPMLALAALVASLVAAAWPVQALRERAQRRRRVMLRELPFILDMVTLCVEAGLNLHGALKQAAENGPAGPLRDELRRLLSDIRTGIPRQEALADWAQRCDLKPVHQFVAAVGQAEHSGMNLGPVLRVQADQWRNDRFLTAEKSALEAPVKMMFPLIFCIFPCSFLIIAFPIAVQFLAMLE